MAVKIDDLRVGRCYVTPSGQVRRVTHIETIKKITYETRGKRAIPKGKPWNPNHVTAKAETFVAAVDREVTSDWDPDYPERPPQRKSKRTRG